LVVVVEPSSRGDNCQRRPVGRRLWELRYGVVQMMMVADRWWHYDASLGQAVVTHNYIDRLTPF